MELSEAWKPEVTIKKIEIDGILLDDKYNSALYRNPKDVLVVVLCKLYYVKSKDLFVVVTDSTQWSIVSSQYEIDKLRHTYLNQERKKSVNDAFVQDDESNFTSFKSELDVNNIEYIKEHGQFLERIDSNNCDVYYLDYFDKFVVFDFVTNTGYDMDTHEYREKFGIPFKNQQFK